MSDQGMAAYIAQIPEPDTLEQAIAERNAWIETAVQFSRNEDYYRGLLDQIAESIGDEAWVQDDGGRIPRTEGPLRAKLPELVAARIEGGSQ